MLYFLIIFPSGLKGQNTLASRNNRDRQGKRSVAVRLSSRRILGLNLGFAL